MTPYFVCFVGYPGQGDPQAVVNPNESIESIVARIVSGELENVVEVHAIRPGSMFPWENITQAVLAQAMELIMESSMAEPRYPEPVRAPKDNVIPFRC